MSYVLSISASSRPESSNAQLLQAINRRYRQEFVLFDIHQLPLFRSELDGHPWSELIVEWRNIVQESQAVVISMPAYLYNLPAALKNALEWLTILTLESASTECSDYGSGSIVSVGIKD